MPKTIRTDVGEVTIESAAGSGRHARALADRPQLSSSAVVLRWPSDAWLVGAGVRLGRLKNHPESRRRKDPSAEGPPTLSALRRKALQEGMRLVANQGAPGRIIARISSDASVERSWNVRGKPNDSIPVVLLDYRDVGEVLVSQDGAQVDRHCCFSVGGGNKCGGRTTTLTRRRQAHGPTTPAPLSPSVDPG
jgi:hypothetical protein